jgi:hypothetical protein
MTPGHYHSSLGKATAVIDCSAKEVCAWDFLSCGRVNMRASRDRRDPAKFVVAEHSPHNVVTAGVYVRAATQLQPTRHNSPAHAHRYKIETFLTNREFVIERLIYADGDDIISMGASVPDADADKMDYGYNPSMMRAHTRMFFHAAPIDANQCTVNFVMHIDSTGLMATSRVLRKHIPKQLHIVFDARNTFERDVEIDGLGRQPLLLSMQNHEPLHDESEIAMMEAAKMKYDGVADSDMKRLASPDPLVSMMGAFNKEHPIAVGRARTILCATPEHAASMEVADCGNRQVCAATCRCWAPPLTRAFSFALS